MPNSTTGSSSSSSKDHALFHTMLLSLNIIIVFINIVGNILTICVICRFKTLRYPSNVMIAGLAVSDLLMGSVYTPIVLLRTNLPFLFTNRTSCLAILFTGQLLVLGNIVFQSSLSMERFYAVQFPYHYYSSVTVKHNLIWSCVAVAGISFINIPVLCGIDHWSENAKCYAPTLFLCVYSRFYIGTFLAFQLVGVLAFWRVLAAELSFRRRDRTLQTSDVQKQQSVQSTIMIFAYGISLCFYLPHVFYYLWGTFKEKEFDPVILGILQLLDQCSSAVNCFIYSFKNSKFRKAYKRLLRFKSSQVEPNIALRNVTVD